MWLPVQQYQEDGRIVRGLQRGASSFSASSGVAIVELLSRALHTVQVCGERKKMGRERGRTREGKEERVEGGERERGVWEVEALID